jgi:hypothetical protein
MEFNEVGNKLEVRLSKKHTFSRFVKPSKAFLFIETIFLLKCGYLSKNSARAALTRAKKLEQ